MKKNRKHFAVNSQEDEDGFTLYPENAFSTENAIKKQGINSHNYAEAADTTITNIESRKFLHSLTTKLNRIAER